MTTTDPRPATQTARWTQAVLEALVGVPFTTGNAVTPLRNGVEMFPTILEMIASARRSVDLLWFQWGRGTVTEQVADALGDRAQAGVRVRVLLDGFGARGIAPSQVHRMRRAGCDVLFFRPMRTWRLTTVNQRTHRRVLVCDETVAFTGGVGIDQAWSGNADGPGHWRDTGFLLKGPGVAGVRGAFASQWVQSQRPVTTEADTFPSYGTPGHAAIQVVAATSQPGWNTAAVALLAIVGCASNRLRISTPYTRLPELFHRALSDAVGRGVRVQLLTNGPHVDRSFVAAQSWHDYERLLAAGVEIWHYQPTLLHVKCVSADGAAALVGTTNLDIRSLAVNEQVAMTIADDLVVSELDADFDEDLSNSQQIDPERWVIRPLRQRILENTAHIVGKPLRGIGAYGLTSRRP